ncbi:MAG: sulfotransferase family protein [Pirellulaceae bacterium]
MPVATQLPPVPQNVEPAGKHRWPESEFFVSPQHRLVYCPIPKVACSSLKLWWAELTKGAIAPFVSKSKRGELIVDHGLLNERFKLHHQSQLGGRPLREEGWFRFAFVRNPWARLVSVFVNKFLGLYDLTGPVIQAVHLRWKKQPFQTAKQVVLQALSPFSGERALRTTIWPLIHGSKAWRDELTFHHFIDFLAVQGLDNAETDLHWRPQYRFLGDVSFHYIGRFERLDEDLRTISGLLGIQATLPVTNATKYASPNERTAGCFANVPLAQLRRLPSIPDYRKFYTRELVKQVASLYRRDVEQFGYDFDV